MALPKLEGLIRFEEETVIATMNGNDVAIPAGDYYWSSTGPDAEPPFVDAVETAAGVAVGAAVTVTLSASADASTGAITLASATPFSLVWSSAIYRTIFGFTDDNGSATSHLSESHVTHLWLPNCGRTAPLAAPGDQFEHGSPEVDGTCTTSPSGHSKRLVYSTRYVENLEFSHVSGLKAHTNHGGSGSLQQFYVDVIGAGLPFRLHDDRSDDAQWEGYFVESFQSLRELLVARDSQQSGPYAFWKFKAFCRKQVS